MKAVRYHAYGGPEVLQLEELTRPGVGPGEVLIRVEVAGVNFADLGRRVNRYLEPTPLPFVAGSEAAGTIAALGAGVSGLAVGQRVAAIFQSGGYAEYVAAPATQVVPLPEGVGVEQGAALLLQGLTSYHLLKTVGRLQRGESVLVHAAAGGCGGLSVQFARLLGAGQVIATASSAEKLAAAGRLGADTLINYGEADWPEQVLAATAGRGADVILEMIGGEVFRQNFTCVAPFGRIVVFGAASGQRGALEDPQVATTLTSRCASLAGFHVRTILRYPELTRASLKEMFGWVAVGRLQVPVNHRFALADAAEAHRLMEARRTTGKIVLTLP